LLSREWNDHLRHFVLIRAQVLVEELVVQWDEEQALQQMK
jgi:hypothetical protein